MTRSRVIVAIAAVVAGALGSGLIGCAEAPVQPTALVELMTRPAEKALLAGLRAYDDALYGEAERQLSQSLKLPLASTKDRAAAHKHLAFIYCTSNRATECAAQFRSARVADPAFTLSKSEAGHPSWGEVYKRIQP
ncbi:MAG: TssQ family T6SS-associated lipoprotein [Burkholderiaceae bacterium]